jgi:hypothetical protein
VGPSQQQAATPKHFVIGMGYDDRDSPGSAFFILLDQRSTSVVTASRLPCHAIA